MANTQQLGEYLMAISKKLRNMSRLNMPQCAPGPGARRKTSMLCRQQSSMPINSRNCQTCGTRYPVDDDDGRYSEITSHRCRSCERKMATPVFVEPEILTERMESVSEISAMMLVDEGLLPRASPNSAASPVRKCEKCGKPKRSFAPDTANQSQDQMVSFSVPLPPGHIATQHIMYVEQRKAPPPFFTGVPKRKPVPGRIETCKDLNAVVRIDVTPPTAVSECPPPNLLTGSDPDGSATPDRKSPQWRPRASYESPPSPISSMTSFSFSEYVRNKDSFDGDESAGEHRNHNGNQRIDHLVDLTANAVLGNEIPRYTRLDDVENTETHQRRESMFSFIAGAGSDCIELGVLPKTSGSDVIDPSSRDQTHLLAPHSDMFYDFGELSPGRSSSQTRKLHEAAEICSAVADHGKGHTGQTFTSSDIVHIVTTAEPQYDWAKTAQRTRFKSLRRDRGCSISI